MRKNQEHLVLFAAEHSEDKEKGKSIGVSTTEIQIIIVLKKIL